MLTIRLINCSIMRFLKLYLFFSITVIIVVMGMKNTGSHGFRGGGGGGRGGGFVYANHKIRIWNRIPNGIENVNDEIWNFLESNTITNCFKFRETENELRLRCLSNGRLIDADIYVHNNNKKRQPNEAFTTRVYI